MTQVERLILEYANLRRGERHANHAETVYWATQWRHYAADLRDALIELQKERNERHAFNPCPYNPQTCLTCGRDVLGNHDMPRMDKQD